MRFRHTASALAVLALSTAHADEDPMFKFSGFGTISAVHSSERQADFISTFYQPNGAGSTSSISFAPDSRLGGQVDAKFTDKLSATLQVISQHQYDNSYTPKVEWANVKYQLTPEFSARLGRIALPTLMVSETRLVSYANPWVRMPNELYDAMPITSNDGIDASYRSSIGSVSNTFQVTAGRASVNFPGTTGSAKLRNTWGINDTIAYRDLTARIGVVSGTASLSIDGINQLIGGLNQFAAGVGAVPLPAYQTAASQATALSRKYSPQGLNITVFNVGATYDPGDWFVTGESALRKPAGVFSGVKSWYVGGGYRFGSLTPYVRWASVKTKKKTEPGISTAGLDPQSADGAVALTGGINASLDGFSQATQDSVVLGVRWDFMPGMSLKTQYDRMSLGTNASGTLGNVQPGFVKGGKVNVVTVAVDFVF